MSKNLHVVSGVSCVGKTYFTGMYLKELIPEDDYDDIQGFVNSCKRTMYFTPTREKRNKKFPMLARRKCGLGRKKYDRDRIYCGNLWMHDLYNDDNTSFACNFDLMGWYYEEQFDRNNTVIKRIIRANKHEHINVSVYILICKLPVLIERMYTRFDFLYPWLISKHLEHYNEQNLINIYSEWINVLDENDIKYKLINNTNKWNFHEDNTITTILENG
jgi:hypothetical protein